MYKVIILCGPDGSGKTTQMRLLTNYLYSKGYKIKNVHIRAHHTLAYILMKTMNFLGLINNSAFIIGFNINNRILKSLWLLIEIISLLPVAFLRVYLPALFINKVIVCDRYIIDSLISIAFTIKEYDFIKSKLAIRLLSLIPHDSICIYLYSSRNVILNRKYDEPLTTEFVDFQIYAYEFYSKIIGAVAIDTTKNSIEDVHKQILAYIGL